MASGESSGRHGKRKRRGDVDRAKLKQYGIDLPEIPGIPVQIIPLHVHAVKATTKFFRHEASESIIFPFETLLETQNERPDDNESNGHTEVPSFIASVFDRLDEAALKAQASTSESRDKANLLSRKTDAINAWLEAIHRWVRDQSGRQKHVDNRNGDQVTAKPLSQESVPVAVLEHLLDVAMEHKHVAVRRAATHAIGFLLHKSADCRRFIFETDENEGPTSKDKLINWMNVIIDADKYLNVSDESADKGIRLLQRETYLLIRHLEQVGFGDLYPSLPVAVQRFQQFCPDAVDSSSLGLDVAQRSEADRRKIRDVAMEYFETEEKHLCKLIDRVYACMDILVPRIGVSIDSKIPDIKNDKPDNEDEDDDSIKWEDGWENNDYDMIDTTEQNNVSHSDAVEHTLSVMESTGGLRNGVLEIDLKGNFDSPEIKPCTTTHISEERMTVAKQRLLKAIKLLALRHMPRLSDWVDCLSKADGLVEVTKGGVTSLVTMTAGQGQRRAEAFNRLSNIKRSVATVLQTTQRLRLEPDSKTSALGISTRNWPTVYTSTVGNHQSLRGSIIRMPSKTTASKDALNRGSSKIQIKYRQTS